MTDCARLVEQARLVRKNAYAPYSSFAVGAALLTLDGSIFVGVNVENAAYPSSMCAERNAVAAAVAAGHTRFRAIAIALPFGKHGELGSPCGGCRQVLAEFGVDLVVWVAGPSGDARELRLSELLPLAFTDQSLSATLKRSVPNEPT